MSVSEELDYYQETVSLLQEEIVRLENELRSRDESAGVPSDHAPRDDKADQAAARQVESLLAELANREETINLLLEQSRLFEEAESAHQANWDQINQWVQELERRVESGGAGGSAARDELEAERRKTQMEREQHEAERRAFEAQRQTWEAEAEKLRALVTQSQAPGGAADTVLKGLEQENRRLRGAAAELARVSAVAAEAGDLRQRLQLAQDELASARSEHQKALDDLQRERQEHDLALTGIRSQLAHDSLKRQEEQVKAAVAPAVEIGEANPNLSADERIRAFRQHLKDIHEREETERAQKKLSVRLSRLWRNTGPRG